MLFTRLYSSRTTITDQHYGPHMFSVSVQFIVISLNQGNCEYPYPVEITKIYDLFNILPAFRVSFLQNHDTLH